MWRPAPILARLRDGDALLVPGLRALSPLKRMNAVRLWLSEADVEAPSAARLSEALRQVFDADADQLPAVVWGSSALRRYRQRLVPHRRRSAAPGRAAALGGRVRMLGSIWDRGWGI